MTQTQSGTGAGTQASAALSAHGGPHGGPHGGATESAKKSSRNMALTVAAGAVGSTIEFFDFGIYSFLATMLAASFFPKGDPTANLLYTFAVFGVAFVVRPLGGIVLGHLGDRHGRRFVLALSVTLMAISTALIGLLPTYGRIGVWAPLLLVLLRCVQGASAGGEIGSAATYIAEMSSNRRRGFLTSTTQVGTLFGTMLASFTVLIVSTLLSREQMTAWGWRVPFLISFPLGMIGLLIRYRLDESAQFLRAEHSGRISRVPFLAAITQYPRSLLTVFCMSLVSFASYYLVFTYLSVYFERQGVMSVSAASWSTTLAVLIAAITIPLWGALTDIVGRKPVLIGACAGNVILPYPAFVLMGHSPTGAVIAQIVLGQLEAAYLATILTAYCEIFPLRVRLSGLNLGHNLAALVAGGMAPYVATWLIAHSGTPTAPAWILIVTGFVSFLATLTIRETAGRPLPSD
ncbi:MFS transporter [Paraburkholderia sp. J12]|uniref:MFS transporter n=1 Tax=Paraburkholderia sp. J12 TaxID=2805432 RepID=UPI002ABE700E|nr:MFS transporter [Paraburkholderia sp. J12]